jgi:ABC-2 type transport system permease protein
VTGLPYPGSNVPLHGYALAPVRGETSRRLRRALTRGSTPATQVLVLAGRSLRGLRDPRAIVVGLLQPLVMLLLFSQVFSRAVSATGLSGSGAYLQYLMPAALVTTSAGSALGSGGWLVFERNSGVFTRLRAMPIRISSILVARSVSDLVRTGLQLMAMLAVAMIVLGYRPSGGPLSLLGAWVVSMAVGCGFSWLFLAVSCWVRNVEIMQGIGFLVMFPLTFTSSAYVPVSELPRLLGWLARVNPITYAVDATRSMTSTAPAAGPVTKAFLISAAFTGLGMAFAVKGFRRSL